MPIVLSKKKKIVRKQAAAIVESKSQRSCDQNTIGSSRYERIERENESLSSKLANNQLADVMETAEQIGDVTVIAARVDVKDNNALRQMMDEMKQKLSQRSHCPWSSC